MTIPEPRDHDEHVHPCRRHHLHMVVCPDCNAWARHVLPSASTNSTA